MEGNLVLLRDVDARRIVRAELVQEAWCGWINLGLGIGGGRLIYSSLYDNQTAGGIEARLAGGVRYRRISFGVGAGGLLLTDDDPMYGGFLTLELSCRF